MPSALFHHGISAGTTMWIVVAHQLLHLTAYPSHLRSHLPPVLDRFNPAAGKSLPRPPSIIDAGSMSRDYTRYHGRRYAEHSRHLPGSLPARFDRLCDLTALSIVQLLASPTDAPFGPGGSEARGRALADHGPFELGKRPRHLHRHASGGCGGIDVFGKLTETGARLADLLRDVRHVLQRPRQPIELPHHGRQQVVQQAMRLRPVPSSAGDLLLEQARASGRTQRGTLLR